MEDSRIYEDIAKRTGGDIYIGVVGPVRTGKSTFIHRFLDTVVVPNIENEYDKERAKDEIPQSASGKTIMTTEPKFVPDDSVRVCPGEGIEFDVKMVDCVGYMVEGALGGSEDGEVFLGRDFASRHNFSESIAAVIDNEVKSIISRTPVSRNTKERINFIIRDND